MQIIIKNKDTLLYDKFKFKCCVGKKGITSNKIEGDFKTPKGSYSLGPVYYRKDRNLRPLTKLKLIAIKKDMVWCDDVTSKYYNKLMKKNKKDSHEKLYKKSNNYDFLIPINYNTLRIKKNKGSAIFIHLTKNYQGTMGCIALKKKDMLILLKIIKKDAKIKII